MFSGRAVYVFPNVSLMVLIEFVVLFANVTNSRSPAATFEVKALEKDVAFAFCPP